MIHKDKTRDLFVFKHNDALELLLQEKILLG